MTTAVWLLAKRDFLQRARSRGFLAMVGVTLLIILAIGPLAAALAPEPEPITVGLVGSVPDGLDAAMTAAASTRDRDLRSRALDDLDTAEAALEAGDVDVLLVDGMELVWKAEPESTTSAVVSAAVAAVARQTVINDLGLTDAEAMALLAPPPLGERRLEPEDPSLGPRIVAGYAAIFLLYFTILVFGQFVLMGVMEEKASRVVEVVLSRVSPEAVLAGKIIGIGALGLLQVVALAGAAVASATLSGAANIDVAGVGVATAASTVGWFVLGFGLYAVIYAGLGATITRQEDVQGASVLPVMMMLPGYFIALVSLESPDTVLARVASIAPPTAPIVMPMRTAVSDVPWIDVVLSVVLVLATILVLIKVAARVYRGAALRIGPKVSLRQAWRTAEE